MTPVYSPLEPVGDAVVGALLRDSMVTQLAAGGVSTSVPENPTFQFVWVEVLHDGDEGGFGTTPGNGSAPTVTIRVHVFQGNHGTLRDCQRLAARVIAVLVDPPTVAGYDVFAIFHEATVPLADQELRGTVVTEIVAQFQLLLEEA